jgi:ADP-ribose pyrophosphatase
MMETRDRAILFEGLVVDLEQMEVKIGEKGWHTYQVVRHPGGVAVLPLHEDGTVTLIRQLRPAVDAVLLELPAGRLSPDEEPAACGLRELAEETGLTAERLLPLGFIYSSPGVFDEVIHLYLAAGLTQGEADPEAYEDIESVRLPFKEAVRMAREGEIGDGKTIAALFRAEGVLP